MIQRRWPPQSPPEAELGVIAHGPVILAHTDGVAVGLRCVFAHPTGLHLPVVVHGRRSRAEAASQQAHIDHSIQPESGIGMDPWFAPRLIVEVAGTAGPIDPGRSQGSSGGNDFHLEADYWIGALPLDGRLVLTISWARFGLVETVSTLTLDHCDRLAADVLQLGE